MMRSTRISCLASFGNAPDVIGPHFEQRQEAKASTNSVGIIQEICYHISDLFLYGGLLIFFTTLMSRQKNRLP